MMNNEKTVKKQSDTTTVQMKKEMVRDIKKVAAESDQTISGFIEQIVREKLNAMDRDNRWDRVEMTYNMLIQSDGEHHDNIHLFFDKLYESKFIIIRDNNC